MVRLYGQHKDHICHHSIANKTNNQSINGGFNHFNFIAACVSTVLAETYALNMEDFLYLGLLHECTTNGLKIMISPDLIGTAAEYPGNTK